MTFASVSRWYVGFYGRVHWWARPFLRDGFRHCCAFGYCVALERWVWVDASLTGVAVQFMDNDGLVWRLTALRRLGCAILRGPDFDWRARRVGRKRGFWRVAPWCVAVTVGVVGSRSRALRPVAFYRDLVRDGWEIAFDGVGSGAGGDTGGVACVGGLGADEGQDAPAQGRGRRSGGESAASRV